jgi:hypothetical protein
MKWLVLAALAGVALAYVLMSGFADVPCEDGVWDSVRQRCIPT